MKSNFRVWAKKLLNKLENNIKQVELVLYYLFYVRAKQCNGRTRHSSLKKSKKWKLFFLRTCLKSSQKKRCEGQYDELQCCRKDAFAVLPKSPLFFKPCKTSLYDPPFGNNCKCMQFIAFDYLYRYPLS